MYSDHIYAFDFGVSLNFGGSLTQFQNIQTASATFNLSESFPNSLIGVYHSESQITMSKVISIFAFFIACLSLYIFAAALITKQIGGLEFVVLVQSAYLSLIYFDGTVPLPYVCLRNLSLSTLSYRQYLSFTPYTNAPNLQNETFGLSLELFFANFSYNVLLWLFPIVGGLICLPLKLKCIRVRKWFEFGVKAVDIFFG